MPARAVRLGFPPQRAVAPGSSARAGAEPHRGGARRDPQAHRPRASRRRSRGRSSGSSTASRTSTTTSTTRSATRSSRPTTFCRRRRSRCSARRAREAIDALVHDLVEASARAGDIVQSEEVGAAMLALRAFMFERVYLGREPLRRARARARIIAGSSTTSPSARATSRRDRRLRLRHDRPLRARTPRRADGAIKDTSVDAGEAAADMVEVVAGGRSCARPARGYTGRCPFHEERTPSFSVNPPTSSTTASAAASGGDVITFVRETEGLDFVGAVEWLADRFASRSSTRRPRRARRSAAAQRPAVRAARAGGVVLRAHLWESAAGARCASTSRRAARRGRLSRVPARALARAGTLAGEKAQEKGFTRRRAARRRPRQPRAATTTSRQRLMFPLADARGRVVGFQAPQLREDDPLPASTSTRPRASSSTRVDPLRPPPRPDGDRQGGSGRRRRGQHGRDRAPPGGLRAGRRLDGDRAHRAQLKELRRLTRRSTSASTPTRPGRRRRCAGWSSPSARLRRSRRHAAQGPGSRRRADGFEDRLGRRELRRPPRAARARPGAGPPGGVRAGARDPAAAEDSPEWQDALRLLAGRLDLPKETLRA